MHIKDYESFQTYSSILLVIPLVILAIIYTHSSNTGNLLFTKIAIIGIIMYVCLYVSAVIVLLTMLLVWHIIEQINHR